MNEKTYKKVKKPDKRFVNVVKSKKVAVKFTSAECVSLGNNEANGEKAIHDTDDHPQHLT